jgi:hypothetical protein
MAGPVSLSDLLVVGYSDVLPPSIKPVRLPPVFRWRDNEDRYLLPPFHITAGMVYNGTEVSAEEAMRLNGDQITLLEQAWLAERDFELWMDVQGRIEYQPYADVQAAMDQIHVECFRSAQSALRNQHLEEADRLCGICILANGEKLEPYFLKAAILRHWGRRAGVERLREITARNVDQQWFEDRLTHWLQVIQPAPSKMRGMAATRARSFAA